MQAKLFLGEKCTVFVLQRVRVAVLFAQLQMMFAHEDDCVRRFPHLHKWLTGHLEGIVLIEVNGKCKWMMKTLLMSKLEPEKRTTLPCRHMIILLCRWTNVLKCN